MTGHTPGPWYVNGDTFDVERMDGSFIGSKRIVARCATGDGAMANARLIAAAPDLLKALKYARRFLHPDDHDVSYIDGVIDAAVKPGT